MKPMSLAARTITLCFAAAAIACAAHKPISHARIPAAKYTIDPMHGGVAFEVTHLGLSKVYGRFDDFGGTIIADSENPAASSVEFTAKVASVNTGVPARDEHLRAADFFDAANHPDLTFRSTKVEKTRDGYRVTGDLSLHGHTKSVTIPFRASGPYTIQGYGDQPPRIGFEADPITILRSDFQLGDTKPFPDGVMGVTNEVTVRISLEATPAEDPG